MVQLHFVGAEGKYQSIETQAVRIHENLVKVGGDRVQSRLSLLSQDFFRRRGLLRRAPTRAMEALLDETHVLIVVKSSLFREFLKVAPQLREMCRRRGVVLVSNPCDGPGADTGNTQDVFSDQIADYAFAVSRLQREAMVKMRAPEEVLLVAHASRLETAARLQPRSTVRKVLWENAIHHNPRYDSRKVGMPWEKYQELEDSLTELLGEHGAELLFIDAWREAQTYAEWEQTVLDADIAIECKALGSQYIDYQSQKPAVKVLNYMSLGLPVVCDSLPAYRDLGEEGKELLFADTLAEWRVQLARLLDDFDLRVRLGEAARKAAEPYSIDRVCERYMGFFERITSGPAVGTRVAPVKA